MRIVILLALALLTGPVAAQSYDPSGEVIVTLGTQRFDPTTVDLRRGVRLTFHNLSLRETLTVVSADGGFESWPLGKHGQWSHTFQKAGRYEYFVKEHPDVRGVAEVR